MSAKASAPSRELVAINREVQRLLGRCLLRFQQAEKVLKAIVATHHVAGSGEDAASLSNRRAADVAKLGLGEVVDLFLEDVVRVPGGSEEQAKPAKKKSQGRPGKAALIAKRQDDAKAAAGAAGRAWFTTTLTIETPSEDAQALVRELRALVVLRNRVVHRFSDEHEIRTVHGCERAATFLNETDQALHGYLETLKVWVETVAEAQSAYSAAMTDPKVLDALFSGVPARPGDEAGAL